MKILYAIQGTGNGHISRANAMATAFRTHPGIDVEWLLSGRDKIKGCGEIDTFHWREGLTFVVEAGKINTRKTLQKNNLLQFRRDINELDLSAYDLIVSDFEPVTCHAARKQGIPVLGIGHQYAFNHAIPMRGTNLISKALMRHFAPVTQGIGLHWHHFGFPILPPIIDMPVPEVLPAIIDNKVLVYLPFEDPLQFRATLENINDFEFYIYHPDLNNEDDGHLHTRAISRNGFKTDLLDARQIIANSGFELISECLYIGKSILTKPLQGQMEQLSNARALEELDYATVIDRLDENKIRTWLHQNNSIVKVTYPNVAHRLARWIADGRPDTLEALTTEMWQGLEV